MRRALHLLLVAPCLGACAQDNSLTAAPKASAGSRIGVMVDVPSGTANAFALFAAAGDEALAPIDVNQWLHPGQCKQYTLGDTTYQTRQVTDSMELTDPASTLAHAIRTWTRFPERADGGLKGEPAACASMARFSPGRDAPVRLQRRSGGERSGPRKYVFSNISLEYETIYRYCHPSGGG